MVRLLLALVTATGFGTVFCDDWPPQRFQKVGTAKVIFAAQEQINRECGKSPTGFYTEACSNEERIVLPDPCAFPHSENFARVACHELAHRFGNWPSDHPR